MKFFSDTSNGSEMSISSNGIFRFARTDVTKSCFLLIYKTHTWKQWKKLSSIYQLKMLYSKISVQCTEHLNHKKLFKMQDRIYYHNMYQHFRTLLWVWSTPRISPRTAAIFTMLTIFQVLFAAKANCLLMILSSGNRSRTMVITDNYKMIFTPYNIGLKNDY